MVENKKEHSFRNLVFEGGGVKAIAYAGTLPLLERKGILNSINRFAGTSSGSILASLLALGFTSKEIIKLLGEIDFSEFKDESSFILFNVVRFLRGYGWYKGKAFKNWFESTISKKVDKNITFQQLAEKGKELYIVGTDVNEKEYLIFSHEKHPDMKIVDAVRISMSIPLFFRAIRKDKKYFVDGGVYYNYPINIFDDKRYLFDLEMGESIGKVFYNKETLGFRVDTPEEINQELKNEPLPDLKIESLKDYIQALIGGLIDIANKRHLNDFDWHRTVYINSLGISATDFSLSRKDKINLMESGKKGILDYYTWFLSAKKGKDALNK